MKSLAKTFLIALAACWVYDKFVRAMLTNMGA